MKKKIALMVTSLVLVVAMAVGGTLAYLTSETQEVKNTFTIGEIEITLDETDVDVLGVKDGDTRVTENGYKLIPGHKYVKDPTIHIKKADSAEYYLFVKVVNEITGIEAQDNTIAAQMTANNWAALENANNAANVYSLTSATPTTGDVPVFEEFTIDQNANLDGYAGKTITVTAYAVQKDNFASAAAAWNATFGK